MRVKKTGDIYSFNNINKPKKIQDVSELKQTDKVSFYLKPNIDLPKDLCDKGFQIRKLPNLNILNNRGRDFGAKIIYDPIQKINYLSQWERYNKSLKRYPDKVEKRGQKTVYFYCSSNSPTGFWEVEVGGNGTFIEFKPPILNIICPRPFKLQDLVEVTTDGDSFIWRQEQGRTAIISPLSGEGSTNPFISIIGARDADDPPILLNATLSDNDDAFAYMAIRTTIREIFNGFNLVSNLQKDAGEDLTIPCVFYPVTAVPNTAYVWSSGALGITFKAPLHKPIYQYWLQENINGFYQTVQTSNIEYFNIEASKRYRILSIFKTSANDYFGTESCPFYFDFFPRKILAADKINGLNIASLDELTTLYPLSVITCDTSIDAIDGLNINNLDTETIQYPLIAISCDTSIDAIDGLNINNLDTETVIYNLIGSIVG